jgi:3-methylcrotonyl-CoA carboxylase alpha subunit
VVRIDTGVREGDEISTFYDPMISKLIVKGKDRESAIKNLYNALNEYKIVGLPTNIDFVKRVIMNKEFKGWHYDTSFIAKNEQELLGSTTQFSSEITE